jgi:protein TonB
MVRKTLGTKLGVVALGVACLVAPARGQARRVFVDNTIQQSRIITNPSPVYPVLAKRSRLEGAVKVRITIDETGKVANVESLSGNALLADAALEAVRKWRYKPAVVEGSAVEVVTTVEVLFKLS